MFIADRCCVVACLRQNCVGAQKLNLIPNHRLPSNKWKKSGTYNSIMKYKPSLITNKYKFVWLSALLNALIYTLQVTIK